MLEIIKFVIDKKILDKLTLSKCTDPSILRTTGRLLQIKGAIYLGLETFHADGKATQKNIPADEAPEAIAKLIPNQYKQMNIITTNGKLRSSTELSVMRHLR